MLQGLTLSIIISSKDYEDILEQWDQSESPEDKREYTVNFLIAFCVLDIFSKCALVNIKRRNTEVPIYYTKALVS